MTGEWYSLNYSSLFLCVSHLQYFKTFKSCQTEWSTVLWNSLFYTSSKRWCFQTARFTEVRPVLELLYHPAISNGSLNHACFMLVSVRGGTENSTVFHSEWNLGVCLRQSLHGVLPGDLGQGTEPTSKHTYQHADTVAVTNTGHARAGEQPATTGAATQWVLHLSYSHVKRTLRITVHKCTNAHSFTQP